MRTTGLRKKIIYVDDVNYSLIAVKTRLKEFYEVYPAVSSIELYEYLENFKPELILLDINMPDVDGYDVIKCLKKDDRYAHIPVIFLTGNSDRESVVKGLSLGAADYVFKPFSATKLIETIRIHLSPEKLNHSSDEGEDEIENEYEAYFSKPNILAVDDSHSILRAIQYALHDRYKVHMLSKSEDVIDFLKTKNPELFLLDYSMPVLNGFDIIQIIKAMPEHKDTPVIMITTEGTPAHVKEALALGAADFIVKPFQPKELYDKVTKHMRIASELKQIRDENSKLIG